MKKEGKAIYSKLPAPIKNAFGTWIGGNLQPLLTEYRNNAPWFHSLDLPKAEEHPVLWRRIVLDRASLRKLMSGCLPTLKSLESWSYDEAKVKTAGVGSLGPDNFDVVFEKEIEPQFRLVCCDSVGIGLAHEAEVIVFGHPVEPKDIVFIVDSQGNTVPQDIFAAASKYGKINAAELIYSFRNRK